MKILRYIVCGLVALAFGAVTLLGIGQSGLAMAGLPTGGLYSNLVIYPAVILMGSFGFWIVFAVSDPGSER